MLERDSHALLWLTTFDGFGIGLLRDMWRIPTYVDEYNAEFYHMAVLRAQAQRGGRPWSLVRLIGQYMVGIWYGTVLSCVPPESWSLALAESESVPREIRDVLDINILAGLVGMSFGVWLVGSLEEHVRAGHIGFVLMGAILGQLLRVNLIPGMEMDPLEEGDAASLRGYNTLGAMLAFHYASSWHPTLFADDGHTDGKFSSERGLFRRLAVVLGCATVFWMLAGFGAYDKASITVQDKTTGLPQTIRVKEMVSNILASPAVQQFSAAIGHLYSHLLEHGFEETLKLLKEKLVRHHATNTQTDYCRCRLVSLTLRLPSRSQWLTNSLTLSTDSFCHCSPGKCCALQDFEGEHSAYEVLGLEPGATSSEVKKAYHKLSRQHHPDKNPQDPEGAAERMTAINNAYEKLNEINKRREDTGRTGDAGDGDSKSRTKAKGSGKDNRKKRSGS
jgi:DnaJ-domain-containing protein 1